MDATLVRELFDYDPETGVLTWRVDRPQRIKAGMVAGSRDHKLYLRVKVNGVNYAAHRLIFLWMVGRWPTNDVDHEDLDKTNNRWKNLREATQAQNRQNRAVRADSQTGFKGVVCRKPNQKTKNYFATYQARIKVDGKYHYGKCYRTPDEAHIEYVAMSKQHHGEFART